MEVVTQSKAELEQTIASIWCDVFRRDHIGRDDNFFEIGGDSMLGMEVAGRLADRLGVTVPYVVLFQYPTIRELTGIIDAATD